MQRAARKNPRLKERLDALHHELARVESDIKGISRAVESSDPEQAARRVRRGVTEPIPQDLAGARPLAGDLNKHTVGQFSESASGFPEGSVDMPLPKALPDAKFATYFGTGSLHSVRPLRQERRVQRNKAMVMMVLAVIILYGVIKMIF